MQVQNWEHNNQYQDFVQVSFLKYPLGRWADFNEWKINLESLLNEHRSSIGIMFLLFSLAINYYWII